MSLAVVGVNHRTAPLEVRERFAHAAREVPASLEALRGVLRRDRRADDRRSDGLDRRIFPRERRVGERRGTPRARRGDTDPAIALPDFDDLVIEVQEGDIEEIEQTQVKQRPSG